MTLLARRSLLTLLAVPAIVRAASLMPVALIPVPKLIRFVMDDQGRIEIRDYITVFDSAGTEYRAPVCL